jgi:hypothetical protein
MEPSSFLCTVDKARLDGVVEAVQHALSRPELRQLSQRAVQAKIWHEYQAVVASVLQDFRTAEENIRTNILFTKISHLVHELHEFAIDATLDRAGVQRMAIPAPLGSFCLDAKERLYVILKELGWLPDFFRRYPLHFYENSFQFVHHIPNKELPVKVKVMGLGIGGSMAVSGLAKHGVLHVVGYEKRILTGPRSVTSRYQNASWRAYDTAELMVDQPAYELLAENRQRIHVSQPDGSTTVVSSDRVQIILGSAIKAAILSAERYGAKLYFGDEDPTLGDADKYDIVALFCGAHTASVFEGLTDAMQIHEWNGLDSSCDMWLCVRQSTKTDSYCTRGGENGAERWNYTIESARFDVEDMERIQWNQDSQYQYQLKQIHAGKDIGICEEDLTRQYQLRRSRLIEIMDAVKAQQETNSKAVGSRFDYIFTNAPSNDHNLAKKERDLDSVVLDGKYTVEVKLAANATIRDHQGLLDALNTKLIVCGGDACVPPNPQAAYGATLACENAHSLVLLAVAIGHLNAILNGMDQISGEVWQKDAFNGKRSDWKDQVEELKELFALHYEARSRSENYFQWVQTLICNMYSLPPFR